MSFLLELLKKLFGIAAAPSSATPADPQPAPPPDSLDEPTHRSIIRVLNIIYNPTINPDTDETLTDQSGWQDPDDLTVAFAAETLQTSHGMARYEIVERIEVDDFPMLKDGFRYAPSQYIDMLHGVTPPHQPQEVDYHAILQEFDIVRRIQEDEIDEVWVFAFPYGGFYESIMVGKDAFWCNAPPLKNSDHISKRFIIMGFSYERGVGEMMEAFDHRIESIMEKTFAKTQGEANLWERFTRYDKKNPGQAEVGTVHYAPNSERDYDWNNTKLVPSYCDNWLNFPDLDGAARQVNAKDWGNGDIRKHHQWWQTRIPHVAGRQNGIHNNWWQYIMDPNKVEG